MLARIAAYSYQHRRRVVLGWLALILLAVFASMAFAGRWSDTNQLPGTDSQAAYDLMGHHLPAQTGEDDTIVVQPLSTHRAAVDRFLASARQTHGVLSVGAVNAAPRGDVGTAAVVLADASGDHPGTAASALQAKAKALDQQGVKVAFSGDAFETGGAPSTEVIGIIGALVILLIVLGSVIAAGLPIVLALAGMGVAIPAISLTARLVPTPNFTTQVAAMIGLGVGIDYTLLVVSRFRTAVARRTEGSAEAATETDVRESAIEAAATAGRSVVLAGTTVTISLLGLLLLRLSTYNGLAIGCSLTVVVAVAATVTVLPAMLGFAGHRIARKARGARPNASRLVRAVQARPAALASAGLAALIILGIPAMFLHLGSADASTDPAGSTTRQAYELTARGFGAGANGPIQVAVATRPGTTAQLASLRQEITHVPDVTWVAPPELAPGGRAAVLEVTPTTSPSAKATTSLVHRLRRDVAKPFAARTGMAVHIGGETAVNADFADLSSQRIPWFVAGVLAISFLVLLAGFRSLVIAVQALAVNLLSVAAAYGVMVAVFQWGIGSGLIGATTAPVAPWIPTMLFAICFGLSMDYEVFLVGSIREARATARSDREAVAVGLSSTARLISAAAAIMGIVFASFVFSNELTSKVIGLGCAAAIIVDATIIRLIVVPAVLTMLGSRAWGRGGRRPPLHAPPRPVRVPVGSSSGRS